MSEVEVLAAVVWKILTLTAASLLLATLFFTVVLIVCAMFSKGSSK